MKALCWNGKNDVSVETVPDPQIEQPRDTEVKCIKIVMKPQIKNEAEKLSGGL